MNAVFSGGFLVLLSASFLKCPPPPIPSSEKSECLSTTAPDGGDKCTGTDSEPNDTIPLAQDATSNACELVSVKGQVGGADIDMFHFSGSLCSSTGKALAPHLHHDKTDVEECLFIQCGTGSTGLDSCGDGGGIARRLPNGLLGCCLESEGDLDLGIECSNTRGAVFGYVVVTANSDACVDYTVSYHL
jgi:hypothetical protein